MKQIFCAFSALVCALILAVSAFAQSPNVTGDWEITLNTPQGPFPAQLSLKQDAEKLTGKIKSQFGETPLEGSVKDTAITFKYTVKFQEQDFTITLTGKIDGD